MVKNIIIMYNRKLSDYNKEINGLSMPKKFNILKFG